MDLNFSSVRKMPPKESFSRENDGIESIVEPYGKNKKALMMCTEEQERQRKKIFTIEI